VRRLFLRVILRRLKNHLRIWPCMPASFAGKKHESEPSRFGNRRGKCSRKPLAPNNMMPSFYFVYSSPPMACDGVRS
jgi:hypothetical protein